MYANKVSIAISDKEAFMKFECTGPKFDEKDQVIGSEAIESEKIVMSHELLYKIRDLISELIKQDDKKD